MRFCLFSGVQVAFSVDYHNQSDAFLPFNKFKVTLFPSDVRLKQYSIETNKTKVEFRKWPNCFNLTANFTAVQQERLPFDCFNLTGGLYTVRVCESHFEKNVI